MFRKLMFDHLLVRL